MICTLYIYFTHNMCSMKQKYKNIFFQFKCTLLNILFVYLTKSCDVIFILTRFFIITKYFKCFSAQFLLQFVYVFDLREWVSSLAQLEDWIKLRERKDQIKCVHRSCEYVHYYVDIYWYFLDSRQHSTGKTTVFPILTTNMLL